MGITSSDAREARRLVRIDMETIKQRSFAGKTCIVRLHSIYDGDTWKVIMRLHRGEPYALYKLRLHGIDTPELNPRYTTPHRELHRRAGHYVTDKLRDKFRPGKIFRVHFTGEDSFGRPLGTIWEVHRKFGMLRNGRNICEYILWRGWGLPYDGKKKAEFTKEFLNGIIAA